MGLRRADIRQCGEATRRKWQSVGHIDNLGIKPTQRGSLNHRIVLLFVALGACQARQSRSQDPNVAAVIPDSAVPLYLKSSGVDRASLYIELRTDRIVAAPGDTVYFTVVARNSSDARIQIGRSCGPAMDIRISKPTGGVLSVVNSQFQDERFDVEFNCELGPYHFAEARDSLVNRLWWKAPTVRGHYVAVAGGRGGRGLDDVSTPLSIQVK